MRRPTHGSTSTTASTLSAPGLLATAGLFAALLGALAAPAVTGAALVGAAAATAGRRIAAALRARGDGSGADARRVGAPTADPCS